MLGMKEAGTGEGVDRSHAFARGKFTSHIRRTYACVIECRRRRFEEMLGEDMFEDDLLQE